MFAVIYIPDFSLQAVLRLQPELRAQAVGVVDPDGLKANVFQLTAAAREAGVVAGMTASQAAARCGGIQIKTRSAAREKSATDILLQTAGAFSPNIEATAPGVCTVELKGLDLGTDTARQAWAEKIVRCLATFQFEARVGIAGTPSLALLAAQAAGRFRGVGRGAAASELQGEREANNNGELATDALRVTDPRSGEELRRFPGQSTNAPATSVLVLDQTSDFLATLPLEALDPPLELAELLHRWGLQTAGEFLALGRDELADRFGTEVLELFEQVSPEAVRPLKLVLPPEGFVEEVEFEQEVETTGPLYAVLERQVEQLSRRLEMIYQVVAGFQLTLGLASGAKHEQPFKVPSPTGNVRVLLRMLQTHLDALKTDAPVVSLRLAATPGRAEIHQFGLFESTLRDPNRFAETLARLTALTGAENTGTPVLEATHRPDSFRMQTPNFDAAMPVPTAETPPEGAVLRRFRPPLPARIQFNDTRPVFVHSERVSGRIVEVHGPYLSSGNWWDERRWEREEWDVRTTAGLMIRVFRAGDRCFVEGVYD